MKILRVLSFIIAVFILLDCIQDAKKNYIQHVDLLIGTSSSKDQGTKQINSSGRNYGQTIPAVTAPFAMTQWTPQTHSSEKKCLSPFYGDSPTLQGFRATHWLNGSCAQDYGSFTVFPTTFGDKVNFSFLPSQRKISYIFDTDHSSPAYCAVMLPENKIYTEITATRRTGFFRFTWSDCQNPTIIFDVNSDEGKGFISIDTENSRVIGYNPVYRIYNGHGKPAGFSGYFVAQFNKPIVKVGTFADNQIYHNIVVQENKDNIGAYLTFGSEMGKELKMKMGTSFTSSKNAIENMNIEIPHWDFKKTKKELEKTWNTFLGTIDVEEGSDDDYTKFYTAMYHSLIHPRLFSDVNGEYPSFGGAKTIQNAEGFDYYCDFSNWDIFRAQMPLLSIVAPKQYEDMVKSLIIKADEGGWLPTMPMWNSYTSAMIGDHSISIITDAFMKGFELDIQKAYKYMRKNAFETPQNIDEYIDGKGRRALDSYIKYGYIPIENVVPYAFHRREQVSRTLEYAYNDWALAQVARELGKTDDYNRLIDRSFNYINVFDPEKGWVCGRYSDGTFTDDFDANERMFYITEGTPKHYTWFVPHDVKGLIELMGGKEKFSHKLNLLIEHKNYWHGNEPSHHIPYMFNYIGDWQKTQETVKKILETEYSTGPGGLSGNDDAGQMSAWYVFSAMGFYPVCPGSNEYQLSSPIFKKIILRLNNEYYPGGKFVLIALSGNKDNIFSSAKLNGKEIKSIISHKDLKKGGKLKFQ